MQDAEACAVITKEEAVPLVTWTSELRRVRNPCSKERRISRQRALSRPVHHVPSRSERRARISASASRGRSEGRRRRH
jgi:hypothetical protein